MASLFDLDASSSDSEGDVDYVPEEGQLNANDASDEDPLSSEEEIFLDGKLDGNKKSIKRKKASEKQPVVTEDKPVTRVEKINADDVWKSFLEEVSETGMKESHTVASSSSSTIVSSQEGSDKGTPDSVESISPEKIPNQVFEFAGEIIAVTSDGSVVSSEKNDQKLLGNPVKDNAVAAPVKRKGLQSVLGTLLNKKQKITTLQKTSLDWNTYKKEEGIEEELKKFNEGKGGFIERQRFLQRSDVRSYEVERDIRLSKKTKKP